MTIKEYLQQLFDGVPQDVYLLLLAIFCLGTLLLMTFRGVRLGGRNAMALLLVEYVFLLYCSTVFFRGEAASVHAGGFAAWCGFPFHELVEGWLGGLLHLPAD